ncbi:hypothetical protein JCM10908_002598 [Rhodotorula pacifica]|uniref:uncharacterized protein n=1 Tax=Rhodotorula pacifica TaxID=1495444 RepID=UPI0031804ACE
MTEKAVRQLRTNFEKLGARLGENLAEHSRDLGLVDAFASGSGGGSGKYLESGAAVTPAGIEETKRMLASKRDFERTEGLKRVIAMMTKNLPVTSFFPLVTSLLSPSTSLQARSLISLYIVHCASNAPELALLSINAYQKDLSDPNPLVRAGAITTLSSMQLPDIRELVGMAIQKGARDSSWYVRRATADAVRALYGADPTKDNLAVLRPTLKVLLDGATPLTIGAALTAWEDLCPTEWDLIHQNYRRICKMLMDVDEWGQTTVLRVLARYGRTFFLDPATKEGTVDPDAELALKHSEALLQHLNPAVVLGVIKLQYYLGPPGRQQKVVRPLLRLLQGEPEVAAIALENCALLAEQRPDLFAEHLSTFFVRFSEPVEGRQARVRILIALANESNIRTILSELLIYVEDVDDAFAASAIQAIGTCAQRVPQAAPECLQKLTKLLQSKHDSTVATAVLVLQTLVRSPSFPATASRSNVITRLASYLYTGKVTDPIARSTIYWLVGQFAPEGLLEGCGPDVVRLGAKQFAEEAVPAKLQLLTLSAKLLVLAHRSSTSPHLRPLALIFDYLTLLARYDLAYEVRDRARFLAGLIESGGIGKSKRASGDANGDEGARMMLEEDDFRKGVMVEDLAGENRQQPGAGNEEQTLTIEQVRAVLFEGKHFEPGTDRSANTDAQLGTFALSLPGKRAFPSEYGALSSLPPYPTSVPPSSIRDPPAGSAPSGSASASGSRSSSRSGTPMQAFGSDSFAASGGAGLSRNSRQAGNGRAGKVVLVPTDSGSGAAKPTSHQTAAMAAKRRKQSLNDFLAAEDDEEEDTSEEEESVSEEIEDDEEEDDSTSEDAGDGTNSEEEEDEDAGDEESSENVSGDDTVAASATRGGT